MNVAALLAVISTLMIGALGQLGETGANTIAGDSTARGGAQDPAVYGVTSSREQKAEVAPPGLTSTAIAAAAGAAARIAAAARVDSTIVALFTKTRDLARHLPEGLGLQRVLDAPRGTHPVLLDFRRVKGTRAQYGENLAARNGALAGAAWGAWFGPLGALWGATIGSATAKGADANRCRDICTFF